MLYLRIHHLESFAVSVSRKEGTYYYYLFLEARQHNLPALHARRGMHPLECKATQQAVAKDKFATRWTSILGLEVLTKKRTTSINITTAKLLLVED